MKLPDFDQMREGRPGCPSNLVLEELAAGDLEEKARHETETHLSTCDLCAARIAVRREGFEAIEPVDPRALLAGIRRRAEKMPATVGWSSRLAEWLRNWRLAIAPAVIAAAALVIFVISPGDRLGDRPGERGVGLRVKGELALRIFRAEGSGSVELASRETIRPKDRLRFVVDLPTWGRVTIIGVEHSGRLYTAWPLDPTYETDHPPGRRQTLPGAVSLDEAPGRETLYLVHCPPGSLAPTCTSRGPEQAPTCPEGCALSPFVLEKKR